jgi:hypothetical protein
MFFLGVEKLVICSNVGMNCISQNQKEKCCLCSRTLNTWIKTEIHFDGSEKPSILCYDCAKGIIKDVDQNSTEYETRQLLQDVREFPAVRRTPAALRSTIFVLWFILRPHIIHLHYGYLKEDPLTIYT